MKILHSILSGVVSICIIVILLISAVDIAAYSDYGWYEEKYEKYEVLKELEMEMPEVLKVTREMMSYLRGNRENLVVDTIVAGEAREFFNEREKAHMVDVRHLFLIGLWTRRGAFAILFLCILGMYKSKAPMTKMLPKAFIIGTGCFFAAVIAAGILFLSDFNKYFLMFHEVFFTNDLWLLNPDTDLLIRMLPEGFFLEMAIRIGIILLLMLGTALIISICMLIKQRNKKN